MRVRIWINGPEGASHDFELLDAPSIGERISIALAGEALEGIVADVTWQLQGIERPVGDLSIEAEPAGSVTMVHVICRPATKAARAALAAVEKEATD